MKIRLLQVGKTEEKYLQEGIDIYEKRLRHYVPFQVQSLPALKKAGNLSRQEQKDKEGQGILDSLQGNDYLILLDESGGKFSSEEFAAHLNKLMNRGTQQLVFAVGGPFGFSDAVHARAQEKLSLSPMTFSHQMVRLFFVEQLYRAFTILRNEPYHHA